MKSLVTVIPRKGFVGGRTTLPAKPPAMSAKPMNRNNLALQTSPPSPKAPPSPMSRSLSMRFTMRSPKMERIPGSQSTKATWTGTVSYGASGGGLACADRTTASKNNQFPRANCGCWSALQFLGVRYERPGNEPEHLKCTHQLVSSAGQERELGTGEDRLDVGRRMIEARTW